jgi:hypothetical protein
MLVSHTTTPPVASTASTYIQPTSTCTKHNGKIEIHENKVPDNHNHQQRTQKIPSATK